MVKNQTAVSSGTGRTVKVTIREGDSAKDISNTLADVGLITDKNLFRVQEMLSDYKGKEKPGTYELSTSMTPEEMLKIMCQVGDAEQQEESDGD